MDRSTLIRFALVGAIGVCVLLPSGAPGQSVTPMTLPPVHYTAWTEDNVAAQQHGAPADAEKKEEDDLDFLEKDIRELASTQVNSTNGSQMSTEVTSVNKQPSTVGRSAAAVFVVTQEMIRRSGATCIPEVLRMVPGVCVSRYSSHGWAISIRGPHLQYSRELLVLIDGRAVYNTIYAGVYWDVQDLVLEDIERIEVIRGPGSTLWCSNAVTGVINIITKNSQDTQGTLVTAGGGNLDQSINQFRVGGSDGNGLSWRVYGKHFERGCEYLATGAHDDWRVGHGGFRLDWEPEPGGDRTLTVQGNYYGGIEGNQWVVASPAFPFMESAITDDPIAGANVLARWDRQLGERSSYTFLTYFDRAYRNEYPFGHMQSTFDADFEHRFPLAERHSLIWGLCSRQIHTDVLHNTFGTQMNIREDTFRQFSGFVQDEVALVPDKLTFTVGTKLENNSYTGFEFQPTARLLRVFDDRHVAWGAITRAVRLPAFVERYGYNYVGLAPPPAPYPTFFELVCTQDIEAETMVAYEIGYRAQPTERFSWDLALYMNAYENLIGSIDGPFDPGFPYSVQPSTLANVGRGLGYGLELSTQWNVTDYWKLSAWYGVSILDLRSQPGSNSYIVMGTEQSVPHNQAQLHSLWDLGNHWELDGALRYMDTMMTQAVPAYVTMDLRLGWRPSCRFEVALVGQNLLDDHHPEFATSPLMPLVTEVRRTVYTQLVWRH